MGEISKINMGGVDYDIRDKVLEEQLGKINAKPMISVAYAELVELRDNGELVAGMQYRITDFVTTTAQENTRSAGHQFDVIVTADNANTLNEVARACLHEGDTYFSEAGANLAAWQIWYCLDNDAERFAWADTENGKGVIYRMIDEWNNDLPYDFKNILFVDMEKTEISAEANYYGNWWAGKLVRNSSADIQTGNNSFRYAWVLTNVNGPGSSGVWYADSYYIQSVDTIFYEYDGSNFYESETIRITDIALGRMQYTFGNALSPDNAVSEFIDYTIPTSTLNEVCSNNIIKAVIINKQELNFILFGSLSSYNTFKNNCANNSFGGSCANNSFGENCTNNSFGENCDHNVFGNNCQYNNFADGCMANSFGGDCRGNKLSANCKFNTFSTGCGDAELSESTFFQTASVNSKGEVKVFNLGDLADLLNK